MNTQPLARNETGLIFNIQKFSVHDGAGIRTLVFLKGCPLKCKWCSNPEGQSFSPDLAFNPNKCIGVAECGLCIRACPSGALRAGGDGKVEIDRAICDNCGACVDMCPSRALELLGKVMSVAEVIAAVEEDSAFYARSGGGLTLSGGEPISQAGFVKKLLAVARGRGIDTALETSGYCAWNDLEEVCSLVTQVFFDIKSVNSDRHRRDAGVDNGLILENLRRLAHAFPKLSITVRTPIIPGFNDSPDDVRSVAEFLNTLSIKPTHELLAYHRFGEPKYRQLGLEYPLPDIEPPSKEHMQALRRVIDTAVSRR
ncbi:MAG: glycyl-radical enzyme activating protein [Candidatus Abyssubacteria bacterium]